MSNNFIDHARRELEAVGQFEEDPAFAVSVLAAVSAFASYPGHSGGSAAAGISMLSDLLQFKNLSPLTNDPDEWVQHTALEWNGLNPVWQNKRNGSAFSEDGGLTYTLVDEDKKDNAYHTRITHAMNGEPLTARVLPEAEPEVKSHVLTAEEIFGEATPGMAEPSDFYGGAADSDMGVAEPTRSIKCSCGETFRSNDFDAHVEMNGTYHYAVNETNN